MSWVLTSAQLPDYDVRVMVAYRGNSGWAQVAIARRKSTDKLGEHWDNDECEPLRDSVEVYAWKPLELPP